MKRAVCLIREALVYRRAAFISGLRSLGYEIASSLVKPTKDDVLVIWNRYGGYDETAQMFERAGARVIVVENGYLGKSWLGDRWFSMSLSQHAGGGKWFPEGNERWDELNVPMSPWREGGSELVVLAQRGIGSPDVRSPDNWAEKMQRVHGGRVRPHPGNGEPAIALDVDLANAESVATWASTAALHALLMGIPVWYDYPKWIGAVACRPLCDRAPGVPPQNFGTRPFRNDTARLVMFRGLAWAMWRAREVEDGTAFRHLLCR